MSERRSADKDAGDEMSKSSAHSAEKGLPPRINDVASVRGTVRTVEALFPDGHYRITLDVDLAACPCEPGVCESVGAPGCYFGTVIASAVDQGDE